MIYYKLRDFCWLINNYDLIIFCDPTIFYDLQYIYHLIIHWDFIKICKLIKNLKFEIIYFNKNKIRRNIFNRKEYLKVKEKK